MKRTVLVTGAGSGIGEGIVRELARAGHRVLVTDLRLEAAEAVAQAIRDEAGDARALALDVGSDAAVAALVETLGEPVHVLVNNAGLQHVARLEEFPPEKWSFLIDVLLTGSVRATRALLPGMRAAGYGRVINIGSIHSLIASPFKSAYVAAKHGLLGFAKSVALENADWDFTINTICPAYVKTPLVEKQIAATAKEHGISEEEVVKTIMLAPMPKTSFIGIDEVAGTCAFLLSPAARNMTAQALVLDGGWTAR